MSKKKIICLFDVDGTLTEPRQPIKPNVEKYILETVKKDFDIAVVGGSDLIKLKEQLGGDGIFEKYKYVFAENGLVAFRDGKALRSETIQSMIGENTLQDFINFSLRYISELKLPFKRGTFIEFRTGMINISPIGRNCTKEERYQFYEYDVENQVRQKFIQALKKEFPDLALTYSIGGQISFDVFPIGWDKTYCLRHIQGYDEIHFFGDKTSEGGNDHEIYESDLTIGHRVNGPQDTIQQLEVLMALVRENEEREQLNVPMQSPSTLARLTERHFIRKIPENRNDSHPSRRCRVCSDRGKAKTGAAWRKETRYYCPRCNVGLCLEDCFEVYHTLIKYY